VAAPPLTTHPALSPPSGARAQAREGAILGAALELLLEVGYDRMTIDAVAERARASKATIYRHFPDKAAIVAAAIGCEQAAAAPTVDTGSLRGDLLAYAERAAHSAGVDSGLLAGLMNAARSDEVIAALLNERMWESKQRALREIVERAVERGEVADASGVSLACEVCCAVVLHRLTVVRAKPDAAFRRHLVDDIVVPLLTHRGAPPPPLRHSRTRSSGRAVTGTAAPRTATPEIPSKRSTS